MAVKKKKATKKRKSRAASGRATSTQNKNLGVGVAIDGTEGGKKCRKLGGTFKTEAAARKKLSVFKGKNPRVFKINPPASKNKKRTNVCKIEPLRWGVRAKVRSGKRETIETFRTEAAAYNATKTTDYPVGSNPRVHKIF